MRLFIWDKYYYLPHATYPEVKRCGTTPSFPIWSCTERGLPCLLCYQRSGGLLPRLFTFACDQTIHRLFIFCGTFRRISPPGCYPAFCPMVSGLSSRINEQSLTRLLYIFIYSLISKSIRFFIFFSRNRLYLPSIFM